MAWWKNVQRAVVEECPKGINDIYERRERQWMELVQHSVKKGHGTSREGDTIQAQTVSILSVKNLSNCSYLAGVKSGRLETGGFKAEFTA